MRRSSLVLASDSDRFESGFVSTQDASSARGLVGSALDDLARGDLTSAPARLRRGKLLADACGEKNVSVLARLCLGLEEALRGDFATADRHVAAAENLGVELPSITADAGAVRCMIDGLRASALLARGDRRLSERVWRDAALSRASESGPVHLGDPRLREMATHALREHDPRCTWLVGPKAYWVETPEHVRVDLSSVALLRKILLRLVAAHQTSPTVFVTAPQLCAAVWPTMDPTSPVVRNRMKVALFKLREVGLRGAIQRRREGLRLAPDERWLSCLSSALPVDLLAVR